MTETYLSLRKLENRVIRALYEGHSMFIGGEDFINPVKVSIYQFHGIEINDFAVTVAATALWISEAQMLAETERIVSHDFEFLPLKDYPNIVEANALRTDWRSLFNKTTEQSEISEPCPHLPDYIMGNPPFIGARMATAEQKQDLISVFGAKWKNVGNMDYVCGWHKKAATLMKGTGIKAALVSTNSICQGEQVANLWEPLMQDGIVINFAHKTFRWDSEATLKAHVHCVIVGFSYEDKKDKLLFDGDDVIKAKHINGYLLDGPDVFVSNRSKPICDVPEMLFGNMPNDGGLLSSYTTEDRNLIIKKYPQAEPLFKFFLGAQEFINKKERWCLWLKGITPNVIRSIPPVYENVIKVRELREKSTRAGTRKAAEYPMLFGEMRQPDTNYILVPRHSSENRNYIPLGYKSPDIICGDSNMMVPEASLYHFGVLESSVHMAWMRVVCGRLEMRYRYSKDVVYNNFPWPEVNDEQREKIEQTAQGILDARALYPDSSLADLYDPVTMPPELLKAHRDNDRAVMAAYGFPVSITESDIVARLFALYSQLSQQ